nr:MAG TPA: hypothetical protein [Caudoviricetes sp.]
MALAIHTRSQLGLADFLKASKITRKMPWSLR